MPDLLTCASIAFCAISFAAFIRAHFAGRVA